MDSKRRKEETRTWMESSSDSSSGLAVMRLVGKNLGSDECEMESINAGHGSRSQTAICHSCHCASLHLTACRSGGVFTL